jgi:hypothetical protein
MSERKGFFCAEASKATEHNRKKDTIFFIFLSVYGKGNLQKITTKHRNNLAHVYILKNPLKIQNRKNFFVYPVLTLNCRTNHCCLPVIRRINMDYEGKVCTIIKSVNENLHLSSASPYIVS